MSNNISEVGSYTFFLTDQKKKKKSRILHPGFSPNVDPDSLDKVKPFLLG